MTNFLQITKQAFEAMRAVPVGKSGKRNGNALRGPYHRYAEALQTIGYTSYDAYQLANQMRAKFK